MPWSKCSDTYHRDPDLDLVSMAAQGLFWCLVSWCSEELTDGFVPAGRVVKLCNQDAAPLLAELMNEQLGKGGGRPWVVAAPGGYRIRSYRKYNPSRAEVEEKRAEARARMGKRRAGSHSPGQVIDVSAVVRANNEPNKQANGIANQGANEEPNAHTNMDIVRANVYTNNRRTLGEGLDAVPPVIFEDKAPVEPVRDDVRANNGACSREPTHAGSHVGSSRVPVPQLETELEEGDRREFQEGTIEESPPDFEAFWLEFSKTYPKRNGDSKRGQAQDKLRGLIRKGLDPAEVLAGVHRYRAWCDSEQPGRYPSVWTRTEYVQQMTTWVNGRAWREEWDIPSGDSSQCMEAEMEEELARRG